MISHPHLAITTQHRGRRSVLLLQGELDLCTRDRLRRAIGRALQHHPRILVVDLSGLDFIDCSGLAVLVWARKRLAEQDGQLLMTGGKPIVRRLIHLAGADTYLQVTAGTGTGGGRAAARTTGRRTRRQQTPPPPGWPPAASGGAPGRRAEA